MQIGAGKSAKNDVVGAGLETKMGREIAPNLGRRRRSASENPLRFERGQKLTNPQIIRTKIVTPLGDAMGLVDRDQRGIDPPHELDELRISQPLRGGVDDLVLAPDERIFPRPAAPSTTASTQCRSRESLFLRDRELGLPSRRRAARGPASSAEGRLPAADTSAIFRRPSAQRRAPGASLRGGPQLHPAAKNGAT